MSCETDGCDPQPCSAVTADLRVYSRMAGGTLLQWDLTVIPQLRTWPTPIEVAIDYSRTGIITDPLVGTDSQATPLWTELSDYAERDDLYVVEDPLITSSDFNLHYRLRLRGGQDELTTRPVSMLSDVPNRFRATYLTLVRRWYNAGRIQELMAGVLLKKRRWGMYCPTCRDRDGGQQIRSQCPDCYDTGFLGGYHMADRCYYAKQNVQQVAVGFDVAKGHVQTGPVTQFQFLNIPQVYPGDVWVDLRTDERWLIGSPMKTDAGVGHVELFRSAPVTRLEVAHIIYRFPID